MYTDARTQLPPSLSKGPPEDRPWLETTHRSRWNEEDGRRRQQEKQAEARGKDEGRGRKGRCNCITGRERKEERRRRDANRGGSDEGRAVLQTPRPDEASASACLFLYVFKR